MGRRKLRMEFINDPRKRNASFKTRKESLVKKMKQLTTLCDVRACMIIHGPDRESRAETWPDEIKGMIDAYKTRKGGKTFGLSDFFHDRKRKAEDELSNLRKKKWDQATNWTHGLTLEELKKLREDLMAKSEFVKSHIEQYYYSTRRSSWFHDGLPMAPQPYMIPPQASAAAPPFDDISLPNMMPMQVPAEFPWQENILDQNCVDGEYYIEHDVMATRLAPPLHTIPPQVPMAAAPPQLPFLWHGSVDDTYHIWGYGNVHPGDCVVNINS